jgi:hypothetical protein
MRRPLPIALAAALVASTLALSAAPAAAGGVEFGVTTRSGEWHDNWGKNDWRFRHHRRHVAPGVYFKFGGPHSHYSYYRPRYRDCFHDWEDNEFVCRD